MKIRIHMGVFAAWTVISVLAGYWYSRHIAGKPAELPDSKPSKPIGNW